MSSCSLSAERRIYKASSKKVVAQGEKSSRCALLKRLLWNSRLTAASPAYVCEHVNRQRHFLQDTSHSVHATRRRRGLLDEHIFTPFLENGTEDLCEWVIWHPRSVFKSTLQTVNWFTMPVRSNAVFYCCSPTDIAPSDGHLRHLHFPNLGFKLHLMSVQKVVFRCEYPWRAFKILFFVANTLGEHSKCCFSCEYPWRAFEMFFVANTLGEHSKCCFSCEYPWRAFEMLFFVANTSLFV